MDNNSNLIGSSEFPGDWKVFNRSNEKGKWIKEHDGSIVQTKVVGTRKQASGTLLIHKLLQLNSGSALIAQIELGATYQSGLVFSFKDSSNFSLFFIDRKSEKYNGYELIVASVTAGDYRRIGSEKYSGLPDNIAIFEIHAAEDNVSLQYNGQELFNLTNNDLNKSGKIGLFSQNNDTTRYLTLQLGNTDRLIPLCPEYGSEQIGEVIDLPILREDISQTPIVGESYNGDTETIDKIIDKGSVNEIDSNLIKFLGIQKPASKTTMEFKEVFNVPLDQLYDGINNKHELYTRASESQEESENQDVSVDVKTQGVREILDLRPKRWYRTFQRIQSEIEFADFDLSDTEAILEQSTLEYQQEADKVDASQELLENLNTQIDNTRMKIHGLRIDYHLWCDRRDLLLREIRTNGYNIRPGTTIPEIKEAHFNFQIDKFVPEYGFHPIFIRSTIWLGDSKVGTLNWVSTTTKLEEELLSKGCLAGELEAEYFGLKKELEATVFNSKHADKLASMELNRRKLYEQIDSLQPEFDKWNPYIEAYSKFQAALEELKAKIDLLPTREVDSNRDINYCNLLLEWADSLPTYEGELKANSMNGAEAKVGQYMRNLYKLEMKTFVKVIGIDKVLYFISDIAPGEGDFAFALVMGTGLFAYVSHSVEGEIVKDSNLNGEGKLPEYIEYRAGVLGLVKNKLKVTNRKHNDYTAQLNKLNYDISYWKANALHEQRLDFINLFNNPKHHTNVKMSQKPILPNTDPLADFLIATSDKMGELETEVYFFHPTVSGYRNQHGRSLYSFMNSPPQIDHLAVLPTFDETGEISEERVQVIKNPQKTNNPFRMPVIKFVETHEVEITWVGYCLGELSHSFNLFPGETKELVIEKKTTLKTKIEETLNKEESQSQKSTSDFEEALKSELSLGQKEGQEREKMRKQDITSKASKNFKQSQEDAQSLQQDQQSSQNWDASAKVEADWGWGNAEVKGSAGGKSSSSSKSTSNSKQNWNSSAESSLSQANSTKGRSLSNQSRNTMQKSLKNMVKKVASETSSNNKVSFGSTNSEEYESSESNKEIIRVENPNVGRTVNYNFFQAQNIYEITTKLTDVKIVVDTGVELIHDSGVRAVRVYELEEFGKIYAHEIDTINDEDLNKIIEPQEKNREAVLAAVVARKVMKLYGQFGTDLTSGIGAVQMPSGTDFDQSKLEALIQLGLGDSHIDADFSEIYKQSLGNIKDGLEELKRIPFVFKEVQQTETTRVAVNAGGYHVESQVGKIPATEEYLETRRNIETEIQQAKLEHLKAQTDAGIFFSELPEGLNSIGDGILNNSVSSVVEK